MIDEAKYQIPQFEKFKKAYSFGEGTDLKFAAAVASMYHEFAFYQMIDFCIGYEEFFKENLPASDPRINTSVHKAWSRAYSMYVLLRTTIEATQKINRALMREGDIESFHKQRIKDIAYIANDVIKHPMFNSTKSGSNESFAYWPASLSRDGGIDVYRWVNQSAPFVTMDLHPEEDFYTVCTYLEHVATVLNKK